jgi:hypothetical protein
VSISIAYNEKRLADVPALAFRQLGKLVVVD